jgi:hypothetical protein
LEHVVTPPDVWHVSIARAPEDRKAAMAAARSIRFIVLFLAQSPSPYFGWAQNDPGKVVAAIERAICEKISKANKHGFPGFDDAWLLISCGVPELGAVVSTFVMTPWISTDDLNRSTANMLVASKYDAVFVHSILGSEKTLFSC